MMIYYLFRQKSLKLMAQELYSFTKSAIKKTSSLPQQIQNLFLNSDTMKPTHVPTEILAFHETEIK